MALASFFTPRAAARAWQMLRHDYPKLLGSLALDLVRLELEGTPGLVQLNAGPLASRESAERICITLVSRGQPCRAVAR